MDRLPTKIEAKKTFLAFMAWVAYELLAGLGILFAVYCVVRVAAIAWRA